MHEYIKRADVLELAYRDEVDCFKELVDVEHIMLIPAADVVPVVHGKWIDSVWLWECSVCRCQVNKKLFESNLNYCPYCGAKMDLEEGNKNES